MPSKNSDAVFSAEKVEKKNNTKKGRKSEKQQDKPPKQAKRKNKCNASKSIRTLLDGNVYWFDSKKEAQRYDLLAEEMVSGKISGLQIQKSYELIPKLKMDNGKTQRAIYYIADFVYYRDGRIVVEDVKGYRGGATYALFRIKKKLMKYVHNIEITEV